MDRDTEREQIRSLSIFRGQADTGMGEGPERPVLHGGEQYLEAAPELYKNQELLDEIYPWLTLNSDPYHHSRLGDDLEGWSYFRRDPYLFVARLSSAGEYSNRAAYFCHARAWRSDALPPGFDPCGHLGAADAFDHPWRSEAQREPAREPVWKAPVRMDQVLARPEFTATLLASLFEAVAERRALVVSAPLESFRSGSALSASISFACSALPCSLRRRCQVVIYSMDPRRAARRGANLLAVPDSVENPDSAVPGATVMSEAGEILAGQAPRADSARLARAILDQVAEVEMQGDPSGVLGPLPLED